MKESIERFLEFNGKTLLIKQSEDNFYIAIKPVCEALNVDFSRQLRTLKENLILGSVWSLQTMQVPEDQSRNMVCLPEKYIYGWIFSIRSESTELIEYQKLCYDILYEYFHGTITRRKKLFEEKARLQSQRNRIELDLRNNEEFVKLEDLKAREARIGKELKEMDTSMLNEQLDIFSQ